MRWYIVLMFLVNSMYGSLIKQEQLPEITPDISVYKESGEADLEKLVSVKEGQTVAFKLKDRIVVGIVEKSLVDKGSLKIAGTFPKYKNSEFLFEFKKLPDKQVQIIGVLLFKNQLKYYTLEIDKETKLLYFEEKSLDLEKPEEKNQ